MINKDRFVLIDTSSNFTIKSRKNHSLLGLTQSNGLAFFSYYVTVMDDDSLAAWTHYIANSMLQVLT